ncbi:MAG: transporter [Gemmatimonadales bacterium]
MTGRLAALLAFSLFAPSLAAQAPVTPDPHAVQPERPTVATHAYTVAPGWAEVEAGLEFDRYRDASRGGSAPVLLKLGLAPRLQFDLSLPGIVPPGGSAALGDIAVGAKWRAIASSPILGDFAVQPSVKLPTGARSSGAGTGTIDISILLISSRHVGPVEMDLNLGYTRRSGNGTSVPRAAALWTASFGGPLRGDFGWVVECFGYPGTTGPAGAASMAAILAGPTWLARKWLAFDAGVIVPLAGSQPRALYVGTVYNLGKAF